MNEGHFVPFVVRNTQSGQDIPCRFNPYTPDRIYADIIPSETGGGNEYLTATINAQSTDAMSMFLWNSSAQWRAGQVADANGGANVHNPMGTPDMENPQPAQSEEQVFNPTANSPSTAGVPETPNPYAGANPNNGNNVINPAAPEMPVHTPNPQHFAPPAQGTPTFTKDELAAEVSLNQYRSALELFDLMLQRHLPEDNSDYDVVCRMKTRLDIVNAEYGMPPIWSEPPAPPEEPLKEGVTV